ncbi:hypothetical protein TNCV_4799871 [Trichonephila clavipes]|uniref:Uncharacterized protein n=1 Tax=Trichonephila clavipes TaxID=2585209 RepID=A0A8X6RQN0_TRICX|nr:hypothetical protein TNCV_4799871 [Trichonephila clavipes]
MIKANWRITIDGVEEELEIGHDRARKMQKKAVDVVFFSTGVSGDPLISGILAMFWFVIADLESLSSSSTSRLCFAPDIGLCHSNTYERVGKVLSP